MASTLSADRENDPDVLCMIGSSAALHLSPIPFLQVTGSVRVGRVRVTVEDDGPGFDASQRPEGHGLALLDARLAMLYGADAAMRVDSRPGQTRVTLDVPA